MPALPISYCLPNAIWRTTFCSHAKAFGSQVLHFEAHHFLGKIMRDLVRHGIVDSTKGPNGGFFANERTAETPLLDILVITDGSLVFTHCALNIKRCDAEHPCSLHHDFAVCRDGMLKVMAAKTVEILAAEVAEGKAYLVR